MHTHIDIDQGHGHVHHRNNCIFVKIFHVSPLVAVKKSDSGDRWGLVDISVLLQNEVVFVTKNSAIAEKLIYNNNGIGQPQLSNLWQSYIIILV